MNDSTMKQHLFQGRAFLRDHAVRFCKFRCRQVLGMHYNIDEAEAAGLTFSTSNARVVMLCLGTDIVVRSGDDRSRFGRNWMDGGGWTKRRVSCKSKGVAFRKGRHDERIFLGRYG